MTLRSRIGFCRSLAAVLPVLIIPSARCQSAPSAVPSTIEVSEVLQPAPVPQIQISPEMQGDLLAVRQHYLDAIAAYKEAPQDSAIVANKIGVAYHHMFDLNDAKLYYERAIKLDPSYAQAVNNLGAIYHAEKDYKKAERFYRKAIKLEPKSPLFYSNLGTAYFFQGNVKKGAEAYSQAFALDPDVFERTGASKIEESSSSKDLAAVNYELAKTYAKAGLNERALSYLRRALGEGFNDRKKLMNDPELASLRETPEFLQLLSLRRQ
jgi:tetratricopeptide (TPR) repeat protein